jgi:integrase
MRYKSGKVSSGTIRRMMADWDRFYAPEKDFISEPFGNITKIQIDNFLNGVLDKYHLKKKSFYNMCGILKQCFQYAVDAEYTDKNPYRTNVSKKKFAGNPKKTSKKEVYQKDEKELFIAEMERRIMNNPSNTAPIAVMLDFELGTRKGEILAISESDISDNHVHIHRQVVEDWDVSDLDNIKSLGFKVVEYTKSDDGDRVLPLTDKAKRLIRKVKEVNAEYGNLYKDYLFVRNGYIMSPDALDAQVKRGCEYIGIPVKTMHKIRKTYASTLLHNGVNLSIVKDMLGHADESTTLKHYIFNTETDDETDKSVLSALSGVVEESAASEKGTLGDTKIICFPSNKKTENLRKIKAFSS